MRIAMGALGQDLMNDLITAQGGDTFNPNDPTYALQSAASSPSAVSSLTPAQQTFLQTGTLPGSSSNTALLIAALAVGGLFLLMVKR